MGNFLRPLALFFFSLGGLGLLLLGVLDSSFLMLPLGNDLLVVALTARHAGRIFYYAAMATAGSVTGVAIAHWLASVTGRKAIEGKRKSKRIEFVERQIEKYGGFAIAFASIAPPGFPFTPFIVVSAALQYPMKKMLLIVAAGRFARFMLEGWLATIYGHRLIQMASSKAFEDAVLALVVISLVGSAFSIWGWVRQSRSGRRA